MVRTGLAILVSLIITAVVYVIAYPVLTLWDIARGNVNWIQTLLMSGVAGGMAGAAGYYAAFRLVKSFNPRGVAVGYSGAILVMGAVVGYNALTRAVPGQYGVLDFAALACTHLGAIIGFLIVQAQLPLVDREVAAGRKP